MHGTTAYGRMDDYFARGFVDFEGVASEQRSSHKIEGSVNVIQDSFVDFSDFKQIADTGLYQFFNPPEITEC